MRLKAHKSAEVLLENYFTPEGPPAPSALIGLLIKLNINEHTDLDIKVADQITRSCKALAAV